MTPSPQHSKSGRTLPQSTTWPSLRDGYYMLAICMIRDMSGPSTSLFNYGGDYVSGRPANIFDSRIRAYFIIRYNATTIDMTGQAETAVIRLKTASSAK